MSGPLRFRSLTTLPPYRLDRSVAMFWLTFALGVLTVEHASAQRGSSAKGSDFLRFPCSQLVIDQVDPLVSPGMIPSPHMHQIVGGDSFNATVSTMTVSYAFF